MDRALRRGQALVEAAVALPLFVVLLLVALRLSDLGLAQLKAQEAARSLAWKAHAVKDARAEARRSLPPRMGMRVQEARQSMGPTVAKGLQGEDPVVGGWVGRALGTSKGEVTLSVSPWPWGGKRLSVEATHVVDVGRPAGEGSLVKWVKGRIGAKVPAPIAIPGGAR